MPLARVVVLRLIVLIFLSSSIRCLSFFFFFSLLLCRCCGCVRPAGLINRVRKKDVNERCLQGFFSLCLDAVAAATRGQQQSFVAVIREEPLAAGMVGASGLSNARHHCRPTAFRCTEPSSRPIRYLLRSTPPLHFCSTPPLHRLLVAERCPASPGVKARTRTSLTNHHKSAPTRCAAR